MSAPSPFPLPLTTEPFVNREETQELNRINVRKKKIKRWVLVDCEKGIYKVLEFHREMFGTKVEVNLSCSPLIPLRRYRFPAVICPLNALSPFKPTGVLREDGRDVQSDAFTRAPVRGSRAQNAHPRTFTGDDFRGGVDHRARRGQSSGGGGMSALPGPARGITAVAPLPAS